MARPEAATTRNNAVETAVMYFLNWALITPGPPQRPGRGQAGRHPGKRGRRSAKRPRPNTEAPSPTGTRSSHDPPRMDLGPAPWLREARPDKADDQDAGNDAKRGDPQAVSYTHLTLPTIYS